jgi:hypothetical protein
MKRLLLAGAVLVACAPEPVVIPRMIVTPHAIDFGDALDGRRPLFIQNVGPPGSVLHVPALRFRDGSDFRLTPSNALEVASGETARLEIELLHASAPLSSDTLEIAADDLAAPQRVTAIARADGRCSYRLNPQSVLDFGTVSENRELAINVTNTSTRTCHLFDVVLTADSDAAFAISSAPSDLAPGRSAQIIVRTTPRVPEQTVTGTLRVDDVTVSLSAHLLVSTLFVAPNDFDFGTVAQGCSASTHVHVYPWVGQASLEELRMLAGSDDFSLMSSTGTFPDLELVFQFTPHQLGARAGAFLIRASGNDYVITLRGDGDAQRHHVDTFFQEPPARSTLFLTDTPSQGSLTVTVNGALVSSYQFDAAQNALVFPPGQPPMGSTISAAYEVTCR